MGEPDGQRVTHTPSCTTHMSMLGGQLPKDTHTGANDMRQLASYSNSTRSKLGQNSTRVSSTRARASSTRARARLELELELEMLTSRVEQLVTRLEKLARYSKIFCI